jgi:uncharacterized membrane protein YoaK (UPF0700 family)
VTERAAVRVASASTLLAAASGVVDLWAVTSLGGPFAGVVTGNLVTVGGAAGRGDAGAVWPPLVAVLGFAVGVAVWSFAWRRRPDAVGGPLLAELAVLGVLAVGWSLSAKPLVLLAGAAAAMGGQSSVALRLGESTTYLTGTLTGAMAALVTNGSRGRVVALKQLGAVVAGAVAAALVLGVLPRAVPVLAVLLVVGALAVPGLVPGGGRRDSDRTPG